MAFGAQRYLSAFVVSVVLDFVYISFALQGCESCQTICVIFPERCGLFEGLSEYGVVFETYRR